MSKEQIKKLHQDMGLTANEKIAVWITRRTGTMGMFYLLAGWYFFWMLLNVVMGPHAFDPYPFSLLLFSSNAIQLLWLPVLSVGQNVLNREQMAQAEENLEIDEEQNEKLTDMQHDFDEIQVDSDQMLKEIEQLKQDNAELKQQNQMMMQMMQQLLAKQGN